MERLDVLGHRELRATLLFARAHPRPVTAAEVASVLGVPRSAARWRLERLAAAGLLVSAFERRSGRSGPGAGRPAKTYAVAPETTQLEFPARRYEQLLELLISALPRRSRPARLAEVGFRFGRQLASAARLRTTANPALAFERICRALGRLGFQASVLSVSESEAVILTPTCPLRPLVVTDSEARAIDQSMWRGLVAGALTGYTVSDAACETHDCLDTGSPCRIVLTLGPTVQAAQAPQPA